MTIIARRVWRIGRLTLFCQDGAYFVRCENRTYDHTNPVPLDKVDRWEAPRADRKIDG